MKIKVVREKFSTEYTLGRILIDDKHFGFTCEDADRKLEDSKDGSEKIPGKTAIPRGTYRVVASFSHKFQKVLPEILEVPYFTGVRFHGGNTAADSEGCILIGQKRTATGCAICAPLVGRLTALLESVADNGENATLEIV